MAEQKIDIPQKHQAVRFSKWLAEKDASQIGLALAEVDVPKVAEGQVLVKVASASVNPVDWKLLKDNGFPSPDKKVGTEAHWGPGMDYSGIVVAVGAGVKHLAVGDAVWAMSNFTASAWSQYHLINAGQVSKAPKGITFGQAAALPLVALTSYQSLKDVGGLKKGGKVLVLGGAGGTGHVALQIAQDLEASVVATTASAPKFDFVKEHGATKIINYREQKWWEELKGEDFDVVYDCTGEDNAWLNAQAVLKPKTGAFVSIVVFQKQEVAEDKLVGASWTAHLVKPNTADLEALAKLVEDGKLKVHVQEAIEFSSEGLVKTLQTSLDGRIKGKVVIAVDKDQVDQKIE